jgi:hypothetical protein
MPRSRKDIGHFGEKHDGLGFTRGEPGPSTNLQCTRFEQCLDSPGEVEAQITQTKKLGTIDSAVLQSFRCWPAYQVRPRVRRD